MPVDTTLRANEPRWIEFAWPTFERDNASGFSNTHWTHFVCTHRVPLDSATVVTSSCVYYSRREDPRLVITKHSHSVAKGASTGSESMLCAGLTRRTCVWHQRTGRELQLLQNVKHIGSSYQSAVHA